MHSDRPRVYVAGPISRGDLRGNLDQAREAGLALIRAGYAPLVPHLTCFLGGDTPDLTGGGIPARVWYEVDLPWVAVADAVLRLPGESVGADLETETAEALGIPVFSSIAELIAWGIQ